MSVQVAGNHRALVILLAAFVLLAATYSIVTPIFEAGDEVWHYPVVQHIASGRGLPIQDPTVKTLWEQEGGQPPLYYAVSALATFWIDTRDLEERRWINPHAQIGIPLLFGNKNLVVHTSAEDFPWRGTTLAVHLIRFLSIFFSAMTVALTYLLALELKPGDKKIAAVSAAFVAFNPMFLFISASVNNDSLAVLLATLSLLLLARLLTRGATLERLVGLGIVLGLAALTKVSDLGLLIVAAVVFAYLLGRGSARIRADEYKEKSGIFPVYPRPIWRVVFGCVLSAAIVVVIAFWWYGRNWLLYGDPLAFNVWLAIAGARPQPVSLLSLLNEFQGFRISFWGNFGGVNIIAPEWVYITLDAIAILAIIGLLIGVARRALPRLLVLPALWLATISAALIRWTFLTLASQGRLMFPAISAVAVLLAFGLAQYEVSGFEISRFQVFRHSPFAIRALSFVLRPLSFVIPHLSLVMLFAFAALAPFTLVAPAYALPLRLNDATPSNLTRITFDEKVELMGYGLSEKTILPGTELPITLYWRGLTRINEDLSLYIHLFDSHAKKVGQWDAFTGNGLFPTRLWQTGEVIVDKYRVPLNANARGPQAARVEVGLYRKATLQNVTARDPQGRTVTPSIARFKIAGESRVRVENPVEYVFADQVALVGFAMPQTVAAGAVMPVKIYWRARGTLAEDYTVFIHVVDANAKLLAQKDGQPQNGTYPMSLWDTGETIADAYEIAIPRDTPAGEYFVRVGLYRARDGSRLSAGGGDSVTLSSVRVTQ